MCYLLPCCCRKCSYSLFLILWCNSWKISYSLDNWWSPRLEDLALILVNKKMRLSILNFQLFMPHSFHVVKFWQPVEGIQLRNCLYKYVKKNQTLWILPILYIVTYPQNRFCYKLLVCHPFLIHCVVKKLTI